MQDKKQKKEKENKKRLVLLDAHAILHRAYHALPDFSSSKGEPTGAMTFRSQRIVMRRIRNIKLEEKRLMMSLYRKW
jgi:5'-3' exonuclease